MPKKIYDIKPPKVAKKTEKDLKEFFAESKKTKKRSAPQKKKMNSVWWPVSVCVLMLVIIAGVYLFFKLPKADIMIWPKIQTSSFNETIIADKSADAIDLTKLVIPAQYYEASKTESQDFPATGNAGNGGQASGTITVFNKYDPPAPFTFKAGTHFMSDSGKLFVALQKIVIPAAKKSGSKITPSSAQVNVQAVEGGDSYNIAPASFSIPGLQGTPYYYGVYATSSAAMTGGFTGKVKKVTDDDIQGAKDVLTKKTTADATTALKSQITSDYVLLDKAISSITVSASTQTKSGTIVDAFTYQTTVKVSGLAFKKSDLDQLAKNYIVSQMQPGKTVLDNTFKDDYTATTVDVSGGTASLSVNFSSDIYQNIDTNSMAISLEGKNASQISQTITSSLGDQAVKTKVSFWPFWVSVSPDSQNSVHVELKFQ